MSITGLPQREGNKERRGMWGHGRSLPSPPPTAAEAEGGGEPARETPWSEPIPGGAPQAHSAAPTAIPPPPHRAQCTPPGAIPGRPTCLSIDLKTRYRSRLVRISPALPNVKPCGEGHATGRRLVRGPAAADTMGKGRGVSAGAGHKVGKPGFKAWQLCFSNSDHERGAPPAEEGGSDFEIDTAAPQPAGEPIADLQGSGSSVSLPTPASLSQQPGPATEEAGKLFPRQGNSTLTQGFIL